ncbi:Dynamin family protein [Propionispira arboris]|uniref:Dynamin family protein n=1 Tax=Propionispira arboris TaxID=84035 RepID=A0A1H7CH22_9FIRM|nr:dynamin family protein [Propionispira arboris]SEJ86442.1 Dynamin family protein [Propionispira arboris]
MVQTTERQVEIRSLKGKLLAAYEYLVEHKDQENAEKVKQLADKLMNEEFTIAFCGHFSAGKSKMINRVVGGNLLPSSPIPTSANLVKVKEGQEFVKVFFKNEKPRLYLAPYDYEMVKNYCKDGDQIQEIEISHISSNLPDKTVIMDTPGIDSADDAHRLATESAIHLADLILYVMDYNHVQSELNFMFTKALTAAGKEFCLVINQIDKHSKQELSFTDFKKSVADSFLSWGVKPARIFYTSLKQDDHEYNEFPQLQVYLAERLQAKDSLLLQSIENSLQKIIQDYFVSTKKMAEQKSQPFRDILHELSPEDQAALEDTYSSLCNAKHESELGAEQAESNFDASINKIMDNAYLMPFETRSCAESYLAACDPGFKVGFLFTKQKTLSERQLRLETFYKAILEKTKSQIEWHLRDFLLQFLRSTRVDNKELLEKIQNFHIEFPHELLEAAVKPGARLSGEYVLNYTANVAHAIKSFVKTVLKALKNEILQAAAEKNVDIQATLQEKSVHLERYIAALKQLKKQESITSLLKDNLEKLLCEEAPDLSVDRLNLFALREVGFEVISGDTLTAATEKKAINIVHMPVVLGKNKIPHKSVDHMKATAEKLKQTAQLVQDLPGFKKIANELMEKAARLDHKGFTVALFGAFSAGKSSFANALIGERVLPVSPNPMTAAINKIKPIHGSYQHGTVIIQVKTADAMLDDVNHALKLFDLSAESLADACKRIEELQGDLTQQGAAEKTNYTFLKAVSRGYAFFYEQLGMVLTTTVHEFSDYVALEEKSCFVEWIDLYYDCPLTRQGITLVDTPGADSINARHTGVSFDFIKNSDAILFVTYYNHAFSKADREFLIQLGRVKDSFQLDKMFFMINAIDLAENEGEKQTVVEYVQQQLIKYGVRNPHLYPLSSIQALREKQEKSTIDASGLRAFEDAFYHFITNDLANMAVAASENELCRVSRVVEKLIASTQEDAVIKQQKSSHIQAEKAAITKVLVGQTVEALQNRLYQECDELIYYIKQRVFFRFGDFFKDSFNPTLLRDDGRNLKKALQDALGELLEQIGFDFAQELRATTVRLDRFVEKITVEYQHSLMERLFEINTDLSFSLFEFKGQIKIDFETAFQDIQAGLFVKALAYFRNPKSFFEKNDHTLMREELEMVLKPLADVYLQKEQKRLKALYGNAVDNECSQLILQMTRQADDFYLSLLSALDGGVQAERLFIVQQRLNELK